MTATRWLLLRRLIDERRLELRMTLAQVDEAGGPSPEWVHMLTEREGEPQPRMNRSLAQLDDVLGWEDGTSWRIAAGDQDYPVIRGDSVDAFLDTIRERMRRLPADDRPGLARAMLALLDGWRPAAAATINSRGL